MERRVDAAGNPWHHWGTALVDDYLEFVAARCRPNTLPAAAYDLKIFFSMVPKEPAEDVTGDIFTFITARKKPRRGPKVVRLEEGEAGLSARTIKRWLASISGLFGYLMTPDDLAIGRNPVPTGLANRRRSGNRGAPILRTPRTLTRVLGPGEVSLILGALNTAGTGPWSWRRYLGDYVAARFGLRLGDLSPGERRVFIREGKGGHQRLIPVSRAASFGAVGDHLDRERPPVEHNRSTCSLTRHCQRAGWQPLRYDRGLDFETRISEGSRGAGFATTVRMIRYRFERWPDSRYDWPRALSVDLSASARSGTSCRRARMCPDRGLRDRHRHSLDPPCPATATGPEAIRRQAILPSITTQPAAPCHVLADAPEEVLLGVDTHKDVHAAAIVTVLGAALDGRTFPATTEDYRQLAAWARSFGTLRRAGVECTGSYGAALARHLSTEGIEVTEVNQPDKAKRRRRGKTDAIDAEVAARAVLSGRATAAAKASDGPVETLRLLKLAKGSAIKSRTQTINQLKSVLVSADAALRESLAGLSNPRLFKASFAALCGTSPVEASSGKTQRRRLNRGGDRQANAAPCRIVLSHLRWDDRSQDYLRRRLTEGTTRREIIRCLKRYVAREIYRLIVPARTEADHAGPAGAVS